MKGIIHTDMIEKLHEMLRDCDFKIYNPGNTGKILEIEAYSSYNLDEIKAVVEFVESHGWEFDGLSSDFGIILRFREKKLKSLRDFIDEQTDEIVEESIEDYQIKKFIPC